MRDVKEEHTLVLVLSALLPAKECVWVGMCVWTCVCMRDVKEEHTRVTPSFGLPACKRPD